MNFKRKNGPPPQGFQMTPMVDILFLLLAFFVTMQMFMQWEEEVDVKLPSAETGIFNARLPGEIKINIFEDGKIVINGMTFEEKQLSELLTKIAKYHPGEPVILRAHKKTDYENVLRVLDLCRQSDIYNVSFATTAETAAETAAE